MMAWASALKPYRVSSIPSTPPSVPVAAPALASASVSPSSRNTAAPSKPKLSPQAVPLSRFTSPSRTGPRECPCPIPALSPSMFLTPMRPLKTAPFWFWTTKKVFACFSKKVSPRRISTWILPPRRRSYDILLCDLNLSSGGAVISGTQAADLVLAASGERKPFVIFMTGELVVEPSNGNGTPSAQHRLQKPFRISDVLKLLRDIASQNPAETLVRPQ